MNEHALPVRDDFADDTIGLDHEWVVRYRLPLLRTSHPYWKYEAAVVVEVSKHFPLEPHWPTEREAAIVGWFINARREWYNDRYKAEMLTWPLDVDSGTNSMIFAKQADCWSYRKATWDRGPTFWPAPDSERRSEFPPTPEGLLALLDHIDVWRWAEWKAANPVPEGASA
jgi:hypothetical protein